MRLPRRKFLRLAAGCVALPAVRARLAEVGASLLPGSAADFGKLLTDETDKWRTVIRFAGIKVE